MTYQQKRYLVMTQDPTHIGAGGYRLGRVDNSIVREPGTNLPKIPGTSLSGAARSYAAYRFGKIRCAGQGQPEEGKPDSGHCGQPTCPICYTFGYTVGDQSRAGTVSLFDAHIVLFPVHSMIGPIWVSTVRRLTDLGFEVTGAVPNEASGQESLAFAQARTEPLNLGWLMLPVEPGQVTVTPPPGSDWEQAPEWTAIAERITLLPETLFSQVVNANLEVRTSVSIDPETGAAQSGALFTYEALPRATLLVFDVVQDNYRNRPFPETTTAFRDQGQVLDPAWEKPLDVVRGGLSWAAALGVGGMGTRGFGRIALVGEGWEVSNG